METRTFGTSLAREAYAAWRAFTPGEPHWLDLCAKSRCRLAVVAHYAFNEGLYSSEDGRMANPHEASVPDAT